MLANFLLAAAFADMPENSVGGDIPLFNKFLTSVKHFPHFHTLSLNTAILCIHSGNKEAP
jgi:hypothetical protein